MISTSSGGFLLLYKRLERGRFRLPEIRDDQTEVENDATQLTMLLDNRQHVVQQGDTVFSLAGRYFAPLPRPSGLWWVIADFQSEPIHDPTLALDLGRLLFIPSIRVITEEVFAEARRQEAS